MAHLTRAKFIRWFALGLGLSSVGTACKRATTRASTNDQAPADAIGDLVVKVATEPDFPPFEFPGESGQLEGFDIDLMLAIGQVAGLDVQFENLPFDNLIPALQVGTVDVAISAITITLERAETVDFSRPYFKTGLAIAIRQETNDIAGSGDLEGKKIAVQLGTTGAQKATEVPGADVRIFYSAPSPLQELVDGNVDAVINDAPVIRYAIATENITGIKVIDAFPAETFYGIALAKGSKTLATINSALETLITDGTYTDIYKKWFDAEPSSLPDSVPVPSDNELSAG